MEKKIFIICSDDSPIDQLTKLNQEAVEAGVIPLSVQNAFGFIKDAETKYNYSCELLFLADEVVAFGDWKACKLSADLVEYARWEGKPIIYVDDPKMFLKMLKYQTAKAS